MCEDGHRMDAYERAIRRLVQPGDVVLDLGSGTGILAMLCARRGAARVHAVESMPVAGLARQLCRRNGLADVVQVHEQDVTQMAPVERVDLVVSDFLGRFVVDDGMLPAMAAAGAWLKPGGRFCPWRVDMMVAPVGDLRIGAIDLWADPFYGLDLSWAQTYARNYCYSAELAPELLAGPPVRFHRLEPPSDGGPMDHTIELPIERATTLRAFAGWFRAELAPDVLLSTAPGVETHWGQYLFPLPDLAAAAGDVLRLRLYLREMIGHPVWVWEGALVGPGGVRTFRAEAVQRLGERTPEDP